MKSPKLTPIFPSKIKPHWPGVYQVGLSRRKLELVQAFAFFDGEIWGCSYKSVADAAACPMDAFFANQKKYWRGIVKK